jgi:predicted transcriptional regulator
MSGRHVPPDDRLMPITFRLTATEVRALDELATREMRSRSRLIRVLIVEGTARHAG